MNRCWLVLSFATIAGWSFAQTISQEQWEIADRQVRRLPPTAFTQLPQNLIAELQRRRCTIPQVPMIEGRQNVIKGEFAKPGQTDWAVLCSVGRISSILVFWSGSETNAAEIEKMKDMDRLQGWGGEKIVYSWTISSVGKDFIMDRYKVFGGEKPPPIDHQGINDAFVGKASEVLYFYKGRWLRLSGDD